MGKHAIVVIKNNKEEYLQTYIDSWESYLFLNCKLEDDKDLKPIYELLSTRFNFNEEDVKINYVDVRTHTKFSVKDKIDKEYIHYFFNVETPILSEEKEFTLNDNKYKWFTLNELETDERVQEVNSDVVEYIKELNM